jgi:hypothetical protein
LKGAKGLPRSAWTRWLGHCNQLVEWFTPTLHLDVLRSKTVAGIHKELLMIALAYDFVRLVMLRAAQNQRVCVDRISFINALRWLCHVHDGEPLCRLVLRTARPGHHEPRSQTRPQAVPSDATISRHAPPYRGRI